MLRMLGADAHAHARRPLRYRRSFHCLTSSTTYEFVKLEKLEYLNGFYQFSFPFSEGLFQNIRHFCCPKGVQLWRRAPPEHEWPETFWRNRYYSCCG